MAANISPLKTKVVLVNVTLNSVQYALDSVQYAENIARLLQCKVNGSLFRYIIILCYSRDGIEMLKISLTSSSVGWRDNIMCDPHQSCFY